MNNNNIILNEFKVTVNKCALASFSLMAIVSVVVSILVLTGVFPTFALVSLLGYIPLCILILVMKYNNTKKINMFSKKMQISAAASNAKKVMDSLVKSYSNTTYVDEDCSRIKMQYLTDNGVDVSTALKKINNNVTHYNKLAKEFINDCDKLEDDLYSLMRKRSLAEYASKAHELSVKSNTLGFRNLTDTAFFHELEACTGNLEVLENNWEKLSFELDESSALLEEYIKSLDADSDKKTQMSRKMWAQRLQEAFKALEALDTDKAKEIFVELIDSPVNSNMTSILQNIVTGIDEVMAK
jgi:hypothetical protein